MADRGPGGDNHWGVQGGGPPGHGNHGGAWGGRGPRGGGDKSVTIRLTSNPGSYTIPIATLKTLPHFGSGTRLSISVGEMFKTAFAHDSGTCFCRLPQRRSRGDHGEVSRGAGSCRNARLFRAFRFVSRPDLDSRGGTFFWQQPCRPSVESA